MATKKRLNSKEPRDRPAKSEIILYQAEDGGTRLEVRLDKETVWLSLNQMADLFQRDKSVISKHIKNVFEEGELRPEATVAKYATVQTEGEREVAREIEFYNLDVIIFYATSVDYDPGAEITHDFFAMAQNKIHWAIHGHTAAELIAERADASKTNMGLTSWSGSKVRKPDVQVAKNYLTSEEMELLNLIVSQYLDFAEFQARTRKVMNMRDWSKKLDDFLRLNDREVLQGFGKISSQLAKEKAEREFAKFEQQRRRVEDREAADDFAREVEQLEHKARQLNDPKQ